MHCIKRKYNILGLSNIILEYKKEIIYERISRLKITDILYRINTRKSYLLWWLLNQKTFVILQWFPLRPRKSYDCQIICVINLLLICPTQNIVAVAVAVVVVVHLLYLNAMLWKSSSSSWTFFLCVKKGCVHAHKLTQECTNEENDEDCTRTIRLAWVLRPLSRN